MADTTTFAHTAEGFFRCEDGVRFFAEFVVEGNRKPFAGRFDHKIIPFNVPVAILHYVHRDELYADFRIDLSRFHYVGPGKIRLPFVKHETSETTTFVIDGSIAGILPEGFDVGGGGAWLLL